MAGARDHLLTSQGDGPAVGHAQKRRARLTDDRERGGKCHGAVDDEAVHNDVESAFSSNARGNARRAAARNRAFRWLGGYGRCVISTVKLGLTRQAENSAGGEVRLVDELRHSSSARGRVPCSAISIFGR